MELCRCTSSCCSSQDSECGSLLDNRNCCSSSSLVCKCKKYSKRIVSEIVICAGKVKNDKICECNASNNDCYKVELDLARKMVNNKKLKHVKDCKKAVLCKPRSVTVTITKKTSNTKLNRSCSCNNNRESKFKVINKKVVPANTKKVICYCNESSSDESVDSINSLANDCDKNNSLFTLDEDDVEEIIASTRKECDDTNISSPKQTPMYRIVSLKGDSLPQVRRECDSLTQRTQNDRLIGLRGNVQELDPCKKWCKNNRNMTYNIECDRLLKFDSPFKTQPCPQHEVYVKEMRKFKTFSTEVDLTKNDFDLLPGIGPVYNGRLKQRVENLYKLLETAQMMEKEDFKALLKCYANVTCYYGEKVYQSCIEYIKHHNLKFE
jgi:hypothetical protein